MYTVKGLEAHWVQKGRLSCDSDAPRVGSARSDSARVVKVNCRKTNRRKTRSYCIFLLWLDSPSGPRPPHCWGFVITDTPQSVGTLWTSDQPDVETSTWQHTNSQQTFMPPEGFEPAIPVSKGKQTQALDRTVTGTGIRLYRRNNNRWSKMSSLS